MAAPRPAGAQPPSVLLHGTQSPRRADGARPIGAAAPVARPQVLRDILPPTSEQWESKKDAIKHLYIDEGLKLSEVLQIMEARHGFKAT
jgi:hypothetical protein